MKKILISLLSIIFIISVITTVYAATGSINLGASADNVIIGKTFTVTLAATADSNIKGMQASLSYDTSKLSIENKSAGQGYFDASGSNEIAIGSTSNENLSQAGTLYTITFKVLDTASEGTTTISVTNAILALVDGQADPTSDEVTIDIKSDDTTAGNKEEQKGNNTTTPTNTTDSGNKSTGSSSSKNTTKKTTKLPQTGIESVSIIAIIALGAIGISSYVSYRKYKNI